MSGASPRPPFEAGEHPPGKVAWLHPWQLVRTAYHVWLSTVAAEYIDRRETLAALDSARVPRPVPADAAFQPGAFIDARLHRNRYNRGVSIDFIADIGDSWQATYAMTKLMVTPRLQVRGHDDTFHPADLVVLGGDLVYPTPSRTRYRERTRSALFAALPACPNGHAPSLFAIPGNHDWYDGLTNFVREFCQGQELGGWSMTQRRSYFAVKLTPRWWLWGIDIALDTRIDLPQQSYFLRVLNDRAGNPDSFAEGDNIILCTAKPAWLENNDDSDGYRNLSFFVREVIEKNGGRVRVVLAGDVHHYSRYANTRGDQLITAGGAGSYLCGTHQLPRHVPDLTISARASGPARGTPDDPSRPEHAYHAGDFPYPSRVASRRLALGALLLGLRPANLPFALFVGFLYWFFVWTLLQADGTVLEPQTLKDLLLLPVELAMRPAASVVFLFVVATLAICAIIPLASKPTARRWIAIPWGLTHAFLHLALALVLAWALHHSETVRAMADALPYSTGSMATAFSVSLILVGGLAGATLVGIYFVLSDFVFGWHTNEVFASQSNVDYRNFLRMRIDPGGTLTIFPIGLRKTPLKWRLSLERKPHEPFYESTDYALAPHLIEAPIDIPLR